MTTKYSRQEMNILADLLMDLMCEKGAKVPTMAQMVVGTGWTVAEFEALCDYRWNGPSWVQ